LLRLMALGPMLLAVQACALSPTISAPPPACSILIPDDWADGVKHAPAPAQAGSDADLVKAWAYFGVSEAAQVEIANSRTRDAIGIVRRCEARDAAAVKKSRHKFLGIFERTEHGRRTKLQVGRDSERRNWRFSLNSDGTEKGTAANPVPMPSYIVETLTAGNVRDYSAYGLVELDFRVTGGTMGTITIYRDLVDGTVQITASTTKTTVARTPRSRQQPRPWNPRRQGEVGCDRQHRHRHLLRSEQHSKGPEYAYRSRGA
jgi:hypothetical protein